MTRRDGGGRRAREEQDGTTTEAVAAWFAGRLPDDWFEAAVEVTVDREEVLVVGRVPAPDTPEGGDAREAELGRLSRFRETTREQRIRIAREAERRFGRTVSWGAEAGSTRVLFTTLSVPAMTRLRQPERQVLDTLVEAGVARSRADALAWCVKLVGRNADAWLGELREALTEVQRLRAEGPDA
jgi:hypothetical protein